MNGLAVLLIVAAVFAVAGVFAVVMRSEDRRDRRDPLGLPPPDYTPLGPMPPEIAHELAPFPPQTSPAAMAAPPASPAGASAGPGTAAAAGPPATPPASPPPLPEGDLWAPADTGFAKWESDTFVGLINAIKDGA